MVELKAREQWDSKLFRIINSAVCFSLAYILLTWGGYFAMGTVGKVFKFDSNVYYYGIRFLLNNHKWDRTKVTFIYITYPFFALIAGLIMFYLYYEWRKVKSILNVFFVWGFVIGCCMFTSQALISSLGANEFNSPFYQHFAVVFAWWFLPPPIVYALNLPFAIAFLYFAINFPPQFLRFSYSYSKVNKMEKRRKYFLETAIIPFILGAIITSAVTFPMNIFIHAIYLGMIFLALIIGWVALYYIEIMKDDILNYKTLQQFAFLFAIALIILVFCVKIWWRGIYYAF